MQLERTDIHDVLAVSAGLVYFVFIGIGTVAIVLAAFLR
jgi:hypothetical protein